VLTEAFRFGKLLVLLLDLVEADILAAHIGLKKHQSNHAVNLLGLGGRISEELD